MQLRLWLKSSIQKKLILVSLLLVSALFLILLVASYIFYKNKIESFLAANNQSILTGLQTGDIVSLKKSLYYLNQESLVVDYGLYDQSSNIIFRKSTNQYDHSSSLTNFDLVKDVKSSEGTSFGKVRVLWTINYLNIFYSILIMLLFVFVLYLIVYKRIMQLAHTLSESISNLPSFVQKETPDRLFSEVDELKKVYLDLVNAKNSMILNEQLNSKLQKDDELYKLAHKVSHDIRTPLSTLNIISTKIQDEDIKMLQKQVVSRINEIADDLLGQIKVRNQAPDQNKVMLENFVDLLEKEYALTHSKQEISFFLDDKLRSQNLNGVSVLYSIIRNLITNAIEATDEFQRRIEVIFEYDQGSRLAIRVIDNGKGIPLSILSKLGNEPISFGKQNSAYSGSGIAIWNAKKDLVKIGGILSIKSDQKSKTEISILMPLNRML